MSNNVIKRRHTSEYAQIHNKPLQDDLEDLRAIGLLSHMMSRPHDWVIYKTQLHSQFSRKNVDAAWKLLVEKRYIIGFYCHLNGKKNYFYNVSDISFTPDEYYEFVKESIQEQSEKGHNVTNVHPLPGLTLDTTEFNSGVPKEQQSDNSPCLSGVPREQFPGSCSDDAYTKEIYTNKNIQTNNNIKIDDDKAETPPSTIEVASVTKTIQSLKEQTKDLLTARSFDSVLRKVLDKHEQGKVSNFRDYLVTSLNAKIEELELRRIKEQAKEVLANTEQSGASEEYTGNILFYNFLDSSEGDKPLKK